MARHRTHTSAPLSGLGGARALASVGPPHSPLGVDSPGSASSAKAGIGTGEATDAVVAGPNAARTHASCAQENPNKTYSTQAKAGAARRKKTSSSSSRCARPTRHTRIELHAILARNQRASSSSSECESPRRAFIHFLQRNMHDDSRFFLLHHET